MMITRFDRPAISHLTETEIGRLQAAGAKRVVVEEMSFGFITGIGCFMKRGGAAGRIGFRFAGQLKDMNEAKRAGLIDHIERRVREFADTLPLTDEEWEAMDRSDKR